MKHIRQPQIKPRRLVASESCKDVMKMAIDCIQMLKGQRDTFYMIAKKYVASVEARAENSTSKAEQLVLLSNSDYKFAKLKIEEYENRSKRSTTRKKS